MSYARAAVVVAVLLSASRVTVAQVSIEEAEKRLRERTSTRPSTTQPVGELARATEDNRRLRLRISELEMEVSTLRKAPAQTSPAQTGPASAAGAPATGPATQPAPAEAAHPPISGGWRGGDISRGSGYLLDFGSDGTYHRNFLSYTKRESGRYRFTNSNTIEMWTEGTADAGEHNEYRVSLDSGQLTLTPTRLNGHDVTNGRPLFLTRAQ